MTIWQIWTWDALSYSYEVHSSYVSKIVADRVYEGLRVSWRESSYTPKVWPIEVNEEGV